MLFRSMPPPPPIPSPRRNSLTQDAGVSKKPAARGRPPLASRHLDRSTGKFGRFRTTSERKAHRDVERTYRESLNQDLERLGEVVPSLSRGTEDRVTKGMILRGAREYIGELEKARDEAEMVAKRLRERLAALGVGEREEEKGEAEKKGTAEDGEVKVEK